MTAHDSTSLRFVQAEPSERSHSSSRTAPAVLTAVEATAPDTSAPVSDYRGHAGPDDLPLFAEPSGGVPDVVEDERRLLAAAEALAAGTGPMAVDAERASGYRYGQRAYLVQLWRAGTGSVLVDPMACPDLGPLAEATRGVEWVLHAATQDLPCLAELGMRPDRLFDTELGSRLLGLPRVGLSTVVEHSLGIRLAKEHSAVDWSTRPLPKPWLSYAVLDVEVLVPLRDAVAADLRAAGKEEWAEQEFEALTHYAGPPTRVDPWRRTAGIHKVRNRRGAALVRELWWARDRLAAEKDLAPGRVLPDAVIVELALASLHGNHPADVVAGARHKSVRRHAPVWRRAIEAAFDLPASRLPALTLPSDAPPPIKAWQDKNPVAAQRLALVRASVSAFGGRHDVPVENVVAPDTLRRIVWDPPAADDDAIRAELEARGARPWQVDVVAPLILEALTAISTGVG